MLQDFEFEWEDPVFMDYEEISVRGVGDGQPVEVRSQFTFMFRYCL